MDWYYVDVESAAQGPFSVDQIMEINRGVADYYVYREGLPDWQLASTVPEFNPLPQTEPQPPQLESPVLSDDAPPKKKGGKWEGDPATAKQLNYLKGFGYTPDAPMTKGEASQLITAFKKDPARQELKCQLEQQAAEQADDYEDKHTAWCLHEAVLDAARYLRDAEKSLRNADKEDRAECREEIKEWKEDLKDSVEHRVDFWLDTFRLSPKSCDSSQWADLYEQCGQYFKTPPRKQVKEILEALDNHTPDWDKDKAVSFFLTLKDSFPALVRK